ncbi:MAG: hypothetical protein QXW77_03780 [Candidatus Hadarchaeales archaeon]
MGIRYPFEKVMMAEIHPATTEEIRRRLLEGRLQEDDERRHALQALYLLGARVSEVCGKRTPSHRTGHYPLLKSAVEIGNIQVRGVGPVRVMLFTLRTLKRQGLPRKIALPADYDPLAREVYRYISQREGEILFPWNRFELHDAAKELFQGLGYVVYTYTVQRGGELKRVPTHLKSYCLHSLRHQRATELVEKFGFDAFDLSVYFGWTLKGLGLSSASRYLHLDWRKYFPKLLRPFVATSQGR